MKNGNIIVGLLGGIVVGSALGVLFAPDKGCNTRKKISKKGNDFKDHLKSSIDNLLSSAESKINELEDKAENIIETGKSQFDKAKSEINK